MPINSAQRKQLMSPLHSGRIKTREGMSYLEAYDVKAHLTRIFGFGGWSADVISSDLVFEDQAATANKSGKYNWDVAYKVVMRLTIHNLQPDGGDVTFTEAAIGSSHQPDRGESHDMAVKTAESDAIKRCAINLGTQFGLSLYASTRDNVVTRDIIKHDLSLVTDGDTVDTQQEVTGGEIETTPTGHSVPIESPSPVSGSADEAPQEAPTDHEPTEPPAPRNQQTQPPEDHPEAHLWIEALKHAVENGSVTDVMLCKKEIAKERAGRWTYRGTTLSKWADKAIVEAGKRKNAAPVADSDPQP